MSLCLQETFMGQPKLLVFGGNGFVGSRVCEEALKTGLPVVSINRSGAPKLSADWVSTVEWIQVQLEHCRLLACLSPKYNHCASCMTSHALSRYLDPVKAKETVQVACSQSELSDWHAGRCL